MSASNCPDFEMCPASTDGEGHVQVPVGMGPDSPLKDLQDVLRKMGKGLWGTKAQCWERIQAERDRIPVQRPETVGPDSSHRDLHDELRKLGKGVWGTKAEKWERIQKCKAEEEKAAAAAAAKKAAKEKIAAEAAEAAKKKAEEEARQRNAEVQRVEAKANKAPPVNTDFKTLPCKRPVDHGCHRNSLPTSDGVRTDSTAASSSVQIIDCRPEGTSVQTKSSLYSSRRLSLAMSDASQSSSSASQRRLILQVGPVDMTDESSQHVHGKSKSSSSTAGADSGSVAVGASSSSSDTLANVGATSPGRVTMAMLQGRWLHSHNKVGIVEVEGDSVRLPGTEEFHTATEDVDGLIWMGMTWYACPVESTSSRVVWKAQSGNSCQHIFCHWDKLSSEREEQLAQDIGDDKIDWVPGIRLSCITGLKLLAWKPEDECGETIDDHGNAIVRPDG